MLLVCLVLAIWCSTGECAINSELFPCPTWMYRKNMQDKECTCGDKLDNAITCFNEKYRVILQKNFCYILSKELNTTLIGTCPYSDGGLLPINESELRDYSHLCHNFYRRGQLCGECNKNYTLPVYSYYLGCVKCEDYSYGWVKFIAAAFLPLTLFYIMVIVFRISVNSSTLSGFVLVSQILATPSYVHEVYSHNQVNPYYHVSNLSQLIIDAGIAIYAIWNLDFFRSFYKPICLYPDLRYQHVLLLDYAVAVYPLLLIFITFICVKLHDNFAIVVWFWSPFHKCLVRFRKQWNIRSYLVNALATFIVLSYVKILNVSFEFLISSRVYNMEGHIVYKGYWYYDGRVDMTSREYLPYLVLALSMLLIFNVFPLVLLTLYPFKCFQHFLNCFPCLRCKLALQLFMDTFHGCYKDNEHDYRHFAALYLALRFFNLLLFSILRNRNGYAPVASLLFMFALALVAKFQPYKNKRSNTVDIVMLLTLITKIMSKALKSTIGFQYPKWVSGIIVCVLVLIPPIYMLYLALAHITPKASLCFARSKRLLLERMSRVNVKKDTEDSALLSQGVADYNTFTTCTKINIVCSQ